MALQDNIQQTKAQAQAYANKLQAQANELLGKVTAQAKDLQEIVVKTADKSSDTVKKNTSKLGVEKSVQGGYSAVLGQLKVFGEVRDADSLKTAVQGRIEWLPVAGDAVETEAKKVADVVVKTGTELGDILKAAYGQATGAAPAKKPAAKKASPAKKAAAKKPAAKKPAAKKATAAKKPAAKKAA